MVNYYIYAKDFSGSTGGCTYYHTNGMKTLEEFKNDVNKIEKEQMRAGEPPLDYKIIYLHWGDKCYEVTEKETIDSYVKLTDGNMWTEPQTIAHWLRQKCNASCEIKIKLLYIITDGLIDFSSAEECFKINENMHYETVVFHAFNENLNEIDLSVAASFFKSRCIVYRNYEFVNNINISEEFDYNKINIDNFETEKDDMKSYIQFKFIRKCEHDALAIREIDKLKKLRNRLFIELSLKSHKSESSLNSKDKHEFLREFVKTDWYKNLTSPDFDVKVEIEKYFSTLIDYIVSDKKSYSFDALKYSMKFNNPVEEEPIIDVNFSAEQEIEFPDIILDDDKGIPVIILAEFNLLDKIIFHRTKESDEVSPASFSKFNSTMECPLFLCNDPDISESIGYFYTLNVYKQLLINNKKTEPRTRRPFHGGLVVTDTDQFDKYNDYILSATYFNFKKIHFNKGLFYFVLLKNCENKEWMDKNVVERLKKYVMRRISTTMCRIGLSSLPLDPPENTSLLTALWYCVELSSCLFKDDPKNFIHERLRMYYGVAHYMIEILKHFNYDLDIENIEKRRDLIRHVMILKKIPKHAEKVYYLAERIFKNVKGLLVSEFKDPLNLKKLNFLKLNHKEMLRDDVVKENVNLSEYLHFLHIQMPSKDGKYTYEISDKTFRPFFIIDLEKSFYTELFNSARKVVIKNDDKDQIIISHEAIDSLEFNRIFSVYNLFIKCVKDSRKYPTLTEYIEYISRKNKFNGELVTIFPPTVYLQAEEVYSRYQNIMQNVDVNTFLEVIQKYVKRCERIKAEKIIKFKDDDEIYEYIFNEELKVRFTRVEIKKCIKIKQTHSKKNNIKNKRKKVSNRGRSRHTPTTSQLERPRTRPFPKRRAGHFPKPCNRPCMRPPCVDDD